MNGLRGRCQCGAVSFAVHGEVKSVVNCHCNLCRGMNGAAFSSYAIVNSSQLAITGGSESLREFAVTGTGRKHFCAECGSPVFNTNVEKYGDHAMLYLGTLRDPGELPEPVNIFHEDRLAWTDAVGNLVSFDSVPQR